MVKQAKKRLALTTRWKAHLVVLFLIATGAVIASVALEGATFLLFVPIAWALMLAATAAGDWWFDRREGWLDEEQDVWVGHMNPLDD